ncbi:MAG: MOSC N-terminal beta barrel domain-containing protein [Bdellovibrionales bacterium]|nr:MOSC N-terminal beta barrel domain-containing protein [Bdellovibrionales bacterium]
MQNQALAAVSSNLQVSRLSIYPVKSLGQVSLRKAHVTERGLKYDRNWMVVTTDGKFENYK